MGMMQVKGEFSGRTYDVNFAGEEPTPQEIANATGKIQILERQFEESYENKYGEQVIDDGTAFGRGLDVGLTSLRGALGTTIRDIGTQSDIGFIEDFGASQEAAANRTRLSRAGTATPPKNFDAARKGGFGDTLSYLGEIAGQSAPQMLGPLAATGIGTLLGGPGVGTVAGVSAAMPYFYGSDLQRAEQQVAAGELDAVDRLKTFQAATGQSLLNVLGDKFLLRGLVTPGKNVLTRVGKGTVRGAGVEVPTEIGQQALERWQAGLPIDNDEAFAEYREVGIAAGLLGGTMGGGLSVFGSAPSLDAGKGKTNISGEPPVSDTNTVTAEEGVDFEVGRPTKGATDEAADRVAGTDDAAAITGPTSVETSTGTGTGTGTGAGAGLASISGSGNRIAAKLKTADRKQKIVQQLEKRTTLPTLAEVLSSDNVSNAKELVDTTTEELSNKLVSKPVGTVETVETAETAETAEASKPSVIKRTIAQPDDAALLEDARKSVTDRKSGSVSALANDLKISKAKAGKLIGLLAAEDNPIVGPAKQFQPREFRTVTIPVQDKPDAVAVDTITPTTELDGGTDAKSDAEPKQGAQLPDRTENLSDDEIAIATVTEKAKANQEKIDALLANPEADPEGELLKALQDNNRALNQRLNVIKKNAYEGGDYGKLTPYGTSVREGTPTGLPANTGFGPDGQVIGVQALKSNTPTTSGYEGVKPVTDEQGKNPNALSNEAIDYLEGLDLNTLDLNATYREDVGSDALRVEDVPFADKTAVLFAGDKPYELQGKPSYTGKIQWPPELVQHLSSLPTDKGPYGSQTIGDALRTLYTLKDGVGNIPARLQGSYGDTEARAAAGLPENPITAPEMEPITPTRVRDDTDLEVADSPSQLDATGSPLVQSYDRTLGAPIGDPTNTNPASKPFVAFDTLPANRAAIKLSQAELDLITGSGLSKEQRLAALSGALRDAELVDALEVATANTISRLFNDRKATFGLVGKAALALENRQSTTASEAFEPDITTYEDKLNIIKLIRMTDQNIKDIKDKVERARVKAARDYFLRFRRPVDALHEMQGAHGDGNKTGATQTASKDKTTAKDAEGVETDISAPAFNINLDAESKSDEEAFYGSLTYTNAVKAMYWVKNNLGSDTKAALTARRVEYVSKTRAVVKDDHKTMKEGAAKLQAASYGQAMREASAAARVADAANKASADLIAGLGAPNPLIAELEAIARQDEAEAAKLAMRKALRDRPKKEYTDDTLAADLLRKINEIKKESTQSVDEAVSEIELAVAQDKTIADMTERELDDILEAQIEAELERRAALPEGMRGRLEKTKKSKFFAKDREAVAIELAERQEAEVASLKEALEVEPAGTEQDAPVTKAQFKPRKLDEKGKPLEGAQQGERAGVETILDDDAGVVSIAAQGDSDVIGDLVTPPAINEQLELLGSEISALAEPLRPSTRNMLENGDLVGALRSIAITGRSKNVSKIAERLVPYVGNTQVKLVSGGLRNPQGQVAAGVFDPATNTIFLDRDIGMNSHATLHEMLHAATAANLSDMSLPEVRQLNTIYEAVKKQLPPSYAMKSLEEFVAEAFSNPDFQVMLAGIPMTDLKLANTNMTNAYTNFRTAIRRFFNRIMRRPPESVFNRTDLLLNDILAPQLSTRAAPAMYLAASNPQGSVDVTNSATNAVKPTTPEQLRAMQDYAKNSEPYTGGKSFLYGIMPVNLLGDTLKRNHQSDVGNDLNKLINEQSSELRDKTVKLDYIVNQIKDFRRAEGVEKYKTLQQLVPMSTLNRIDPSIKREMYTAYGLTIKDPKTLKTTRRNFSKPELRAKYMAEFKIKNPDHKLNVIAPLGKERLKVYDALKKDYDSIGKDGQRVYRTMRNYFKETYDEIEPALRDRINSISDDAEVRRTAFDRLSELLLKDSGLITPYFPLMRKGSYRVSYTAIDPQDQDPDAKPQVDRFVEYFPTKIAAMEAVQKVKNYNKTMLARDDIKNSGLASILDEKTGTYTPNPMMADDALFAPEMEKITANSNYGKAPSSGFVFNVLNVLQTAGVQKMEGGKGNKVISDILDLALDAVPERSFMQGFRTRKGVRGFLGDTTPTGYTLENFDLIDMMETKGRDLNRQVVQLRSSAKIQKVVNQIVELTKNPDTAEIADRLMKIAEFAQRPNVDRVSQIITNLGFNWTMGLNFSSAALTFFDVGMSVMPLLSGKYGVSNTTKAFGDAVKAVSAAPSSKTLIVDDEKGNKVREQYDLGSFGISLGNLDFSDPSSIPEGLRDLEVLVKYATNQAQMGQSLTQETLELDVFTGDTGADRASRIGKKIVDTSQKWGGAMFHHSERYGREVSLVAAYKLEMDKLSNGGKKEVTDADRQKAAEAAVEFVEFTLGGTASAGRPVYAQGPIGNVLFLFKRFAISKYYMMMRMLNDATVVLSRDAYPSDEAYQDALDTRKIARAQAANFLITTGLIAGASGMPLFGELGIMYDMLLKDDDEDNWDVMNKKWMADPVYGGLVDMTGLEIGDRIALNNMLYRPPLIDKDQNPLFTLIEQIGGPAIGITSQLSRGWQLGSEGNVWRGVEAASPAALRNIMKTGRYATEGNLTLRGDEITATSPFTLAGQALGFSSHAHIEQLNMNRNERQKYSAMTDRKGRILRKANMARREGDVEGLRQAYRESIEHNNSLPPDAIDLYITTESFKNSSKNFDRNTREMIGGMQYSPSMRRSAGEYDGGLSSPVS